MDTKVLSWYFSNSLKVKLLFLALINEQSHVQLKLIAHEVWMEIIQEIKNTLFIERLPVILSNDNWFLNSQDSTTYSNTLF